MIYFIIYNTIFIVIYTYFYSDRAFFTVFTVFMRYYYVIDFVFLKKVYLSSNIIIELHKLLIILYDKKQNNNNNIIILL